MCLSQQLLISESACPVHLPVISMDFSVWKVRLKVTYFSGVSPLHFCPPATLESL